MQTLGPLANNGGHTLTQMPAPDIGAVERQAADFGWYAFLPAALR